MEELQKARDFLVMAQKELKVLRIIEGERKLIEDAQGYVDSAKVVIEREMEKGNG